MLFFMANYQLTGYPSENVMLSQRFLGVQTVAMRWPLPP